MSVVKKLHIQGIRSFSPLDHKQQMIEFQTPLTLILGVNGSGKTTIIEALKYAITSSLPPNCNKGSSFINDPKLTNGYESMGSVKLELTDSHGNRVITTRKIKVTVKDKLGNLTKKELDGTIKVTQKDGSVKETNSKCGDLKVEMCRIMGVSEAILNNVILCHQEDSCWPLDEGKKVKEKFDAIFNTTAYIKCLDQLTKEDKELGQKAKSESDKLSYVSENLTAAIKKKKELGRKEIDLKAVSDNINEMRKELKEMEAQLHQFQEMEKEFTEATNKVAAAEAELKAMKKQVDEIKSSITENLDGDPSQLKNEISQFERTQLKRVAKQKQLEQQLQQKDDELRKMSSQQKQLLLEEGKYQQEATANDERLRTVTAMFSEVVTLLQRLKENSQDESFSSSMDSCMNICKGDPEQLSCSNIVRALTSAVRAREAEMSRIKAQYEKVEKEMQTKIDSLRHTKSASETQIDLKNKQVRENTTSCQDLRERLRKIEGSNEALESLEEEEKTLIKDIDRIQQDDFFGKTEKLVDEFTEKVVEAENTIAETSDQVNLLIKDKGALEKIDIFTKQRIKHQKNGNDIVAKITDDLYAAGMDEIPNRDLGKAFDKKREALTKELSDKRLEQRNLEKQQAGMGADINRITRELQQKSTTLEDLKDEVFSLLEDRTYDEVYTEIKEELEAKQKDSYYAEAAVYLYNNYIKKLRKKDCCPLCERDIAAKSEIKSLIAKIQDDVKKFEKNPAANEVKKLEEKQQTLVERRGICEESARLEKEIPSLKEKFEKLKIEYEKLSETVEDNSLILNDLDMKKSKLDKCSKDIGLVEKVGQDVKQCEENIAKLQKSRDAKAKELAETMDLSSAQTSLEQLKISLKQARMGREQNASLLNKKRIELNKLTETKNKTRQKILSITAELQNREALEIQKKELEETNKQLQAEITSLKSEIPQAKANITEAEKEKTEAIEKKEKHLQTLRLEKDNIEKQRTKIVDINKQIEEFESKRHKFVESQKKASECRKKVDEAESQKGNIELELREIMNEISNQESKLRNLQDNFKYKSKLEEIARLTRGLDEKKKVLASTRNVSVAAQRRDLSEKHYKKSASMNQLVGSQNEIAATIESLKKELNERMYKNAEEEFKEKLVKKAVYEKAQKDIRRYKTALDQAIMMFHKQKMERLNQSLYEYWRRVYKGNDIDFIQIRTEAGDGNLAAAAGAPKKVKIDAAKARKSYNYRVVMVKSGKELDMRGRCSAGQRVLASIIIRIALADSFSARCGIITLDEPTTNLDQKNINSLAEALAGVAVRMSKQKNFQLIVITHDQEFTDRLSSIDVVDKVMKVSRDQMGFSQITVVPKRG